MTWLILLGMFAAGSGYYNLNRARENFHQRADDILRKFTVRIAQFDTNVLALSALCEPADAEANAGFDKVATSIIHESLAIRRIQQFVFNSISGAIRSPRDVTAAGYKTFVTPDYESYIYSRSQITSDKPLGIIKFKTGLNGGQFILATKPENKNITILTTWDALLLLRGLVSDTADEPVPISSSGNVYGEGEGSHALLARLFPVFRNAEADRRNENKSISAEFSVDGSPLASLAPHREDKFSHAIPGFIRDFELKRGGASLSLHLDKREPLDGIFAWGTIGVFGALSFAFLWGWRFVGQQQRRFQKLQETMQAAARRLLHLEHQNRLTHAARVNSVGVIASGIAHELTQPLAAILSQSQAAIKALENGLRSGDILDRALAANVREARRAGLILGRLRDYVSAREVPVELCDLNHAVSEVVDVLEFELAKRNVSTVIDLALPAPKSLVGSIELQQVVDNLIRNAMEALSEGCREERGRINIATSVHGESNIIEVTDNGHGMSADVMDQIFQPFFTTKSSGTGIGLSLCVTLLDRVGGKIEVRNDNGASFKITLPRAEAGGLT